MIVANNLVKKYDNHLAVDHISFTIEKGHIVGFLGPNGAGKSTTMNMITGYISATEGDVSIAGHDIYDEPEEAKRHIGYLPEIPPLYLNMKVSEYLNFVADLKGIKGAEKRQQIADIIERMGLTDYKNRLIKQLSKGYKQRVGMAQALVGYPEVLIFDEPSVGLDPAQIIEIRNLIKDLSKDHTIILSSHIMQEISAVCDTIMIIDKGKLLLNDATENLAKYINRKGGLFLEIEGDPKTIETTLYEIPEVSNVTFKSAEGEASVKVLVTVDGEKDIRGDIFPVLAAKGCKILTMKDEEASLEDIFLEITGESNKVVKKKVLTRAAAVTEEAEEEEEEE